MTLLGALVFPSPARAAPELVCDRVVEDFSSSKVGAFPNGWRTKEEGEMPLVKSLNTYTVAQDGSQKVLRAVFKEKAITIGKSLSGWKLDEYPVLQWRWKPVKLPKGGNEKQMSTNDCAAAVYSLWDIGFPFYVDTIKYSYSSTLALGTEISKRLGHDQVRVVGTGSRGVGQWQTVRADVRADQQKLLGKDAQRAPSGIALLTDGDATESEAEAYYADFRLCRYQG